MSTTKGLHLYDYFILVVFGLLIIITILGGLLYKSNKENNLLKQPIKVNYNQDNEKFLNNVINTHFNTIIKLETKNDSLIKVNKDID